MKRPGLAVLALTCCIGSAQAEIQFRCAAQLDSLQQEVLGYLLALGIPAGQVRQTLDADSGTLTVALTTSPEDTRTLDLGRRLGVVLADEHVPLPTANGHQRLVPTVSRKEILLALLQHGRVTEFKDDACAFEALVDHVGIRQNIVAWAEHLNWVWPNGGPARWNGKYWTHGTPNRGVLLSAAVMDVFLHQDKYTIGCYTATKLVVLQGILDYYRRIKADPARLQRIEEVLFADGEPLVGIEPGRMWSFEADFDPHEMERPGKLLTLNSNVAPANFVPGDWGYLLNTDADSGQKTGYEGSNAIYLGRNRFDDYYNDHNHSYTYEEKLDEVYQWRNGVFSRPRDAKRIKPLAPEELAKLGGKPTDGGLELNIRLVPKYF